jgi:hypothetical protein
VFARAYYKRRKNRIDLPCIKNPLLPSDKAISLPEKN